MTRKDKFLRALQQTEPTQRLDLPLAFRWALNLNEKSIPADLKEGAKKFAALVSR